jgi:AcrR family transcriptional regulator
MPPGAVQIVPVAERAGIAAGTVYRYFPSKDDLVAALVAVIAEQEIAAIRRAAAAALSGGEIKDLLNGKRPRRESVIEPSTPRFVRRAQCR